MRIETLGIVAGASIFLLGMIEMFAAGVALDGYATDDMNKFFQTINPETGVPYGREYTTNGLIIAGAGGVLSVGSIIALFSRDSTPPTQQATR